MTLVFNALPVIVLAKAGLLEKIARLGTPSLIPQAVVDEIIRASDPRDPARESFEESQTPIVVAPSVPMSAFLAGWDLGAGESAVISTATLHPKSVVVLDDLAARRCAQAHGIPMTGTLGLILLARKRGLIQNIEDALETVLNAGLYISSKVLADVRAKARDIS